MNDVLKVEIEAICVVHIVAIIISIIFIMMFYVKAHKDHALKAFLVMQMSMIGWMIFKIFKTVSPTVLSRWWFIVAYYCCACIFEIAFLEFGYAYYKGKPLPNKIRAIAYVFPIIQMIAVATNPYHFLFYSSYDFWGDSFGVLFYVHTALEYIYIGIGFTYCYKTFKLKFKDKSIRYKYFISSAIIIPLILNFLFITKIIHRVVFAIGIPVIFDITPIVFTWSVMVFVYATFNSDFINLSPILRHEIVHKLDTPICVLDSGFNVIYINDKLNDLFLGNGKKMVQRILHKIDINAQSQCEIKLDAYHLNVYLNEVQTLVETQYILTLKDITSYRTTEEELFNREMELDRSNNELEKTIKILKETSKVGARNYIARELHDIIGHSLVVTIKLLEVAKLYFERDRALSDSAIQDAITSVDEGIISMNAIKQMNTNDLNYTGEILKKDIQKMLNHIKNMNIDAKLHFKGALYSLDEKVYDVIKKTCTELVTNSLKHGEARNLFISIHIKKESVHMRVMDNGKGCNNLKKGNGLNGIVDRLELINGSVDFVTSYDEGFISNISINLI